MKSHREGSLETVKHADKREKYYENLVRMLDLGYSNTDLIHYSTAFMGEMTLIRIFSLLEAYHRTKHLCGHLAEIGVFKGASSILFAKLLNIYEANSLFQVHGYDWFKGIRAVPENPLQINGGDSSDESKLRELIKLQNLDNVLKIHNLNAETDFPEFFEKNKHLQFRLVFCDSGTYEITSQAIKNFWPRLLPGGMIIFDQFNLEVSPGETRAVRELLPDEKMESFSPGWMPMGFVVKK